MGPGLGGVGRRPSLIPIGAGGPFPDPHPPGETPGGRLCSPGRGRYSAAHRRQTLRENAVQQTSMTRRRLLAAAAGLAGTVALGKAPAFAQTAPKKLVWAHNVAPPESGAIAFAEMAKKITEESK